MANPDTYVYKNTGEQTLTIINVGVVQPGETVKCTEELNHPDLKLSTIVKANDEEKQDSAPAADDEQQNAEESAE